MKNMLKHIVAIIVSLTVILFFLTKFLERKLKAPENVVTLNKVMREFESDSVISDWTKSEKNYTCTRWYFFKGEIYGILQLKKEMELPDNVCKLLARMASNNSNHNYTVKFDTKVIGN